MRTGRTTRATFSVDGGISISLPRSWKDLAPEELATVYRYMETVAPELLRFHLLLYFGNITIVRRSRLAGEFKCRVTAMVEDSPRDFVVWLTPEAFACWSDELDWISDPGDFPVRLPELGGARALDSRFHNVTFATYMKAENLYQGYIRTENPEAFLKLESLLYPGCSLEGESPGTERVMNLLNWMLQLKKLFARQFPHFFRPAPDGVKAPAMLEIMNNQIRALTGGDVTKEKEIYEIDCWRALTELNFKAYEAEEFRRQQAKLKQ